MFIRGRTGGHFWKVPLLPLSIPSQPPSLFAAPGCGSIRTTRKECRFNISACSDNRMKHCQGQGLNTGDLIEPEFYLLHLIRSTSFRTCLSNELKSFGTSFSVTKE